MALPQPVQVTARGTLAPPDGVCGTCWTRLPYTSTWDRDPVAVIEQDTDNHGKQRRVLAVELEALAILVDRHREEWAEITDALSLLKALARRPQTRQLT